MALDGTVAWIVTATKTANYTASFGEQVRSDPSAGGFTNTLPTGGSSTDGRSIWVKNVTSSTNNITVSGAANIDGASTYVINTARGGAIFVWNNTAGEWTVQ